MDSRVKVFALEDGAYEIALKGFFRKWGVEFLGDSKDLTEEQFASWGVTSDFYDACNKSISLLIIDTFKRLFMRESQFNKQRLWQVLQILASLYIANFGHRMILGKDAKTYRKPQ